MHGPAMRMSSSIYSAILVPIVAIAAYETIIARKKQWR
jgi:hypothetical protein